jgi:1,4-dihydroxy-2-naphthoate octaprenyltransferase
LFFGVIAVVGTNFVQTQRLSFDALMLSSAVGAMATATLVVNNVRDRETDLKAGKRTLAVRLGPKLGRTEYLLLVSFGYWMLPVFWWAGERGLWVWLPILSLPRARRLIDQVRRNDTGPALNEALAGTAQLGLIYSLLLAVGWWL